MPSLGNALLIRPSCIRSPLNLEMWHQCLMLTAFKELAVCKSPEASPTMK